MVEGEGLGLAFVLCAGLLGASIDDVWGWVTFFTLFIYSNLYCKVAVWQGKVGDDDGRLKNIVMLYCSGNV